MSGPALSPGRAPSVRIAAVGDIHMGEDSRGVLRPAYETLRGVADVLLLAGDLTRHGTVEEARVVAAEVAGLAVPVVAVLGNHDHHADRPDDVIRILEEEGGVSVLEGTAATVRVGPLTVGVGGTKGFGGGFAGRCGSDFGEPQMKAFIGHSRALADGLRRALAELDGCDVRVALTHYSPVPDTLAGESPEIYPFLGSYLLAEAIDAGGADLALHGHAHAGSERGLTSGGVRVRNVAQPVIRHAFALYDLSPATGPQRAATVGTVPPAIPRPGHGGKMSAMPISSSQVLRFGVEEEFLLVDATTGVSAPRAEQVLADAARVLGERAQGEFYATQVEGCTPPVTTATALREELARTRRALAAAAARAGCLLVASGSAVLPSVHPLPVTDTDRYRRIAALVGPVADQVGGEICGCHIHIGDLTRRQALAVANRLRPWLPVLQALGTNSPFCEGRDSGLASSRAVHHSGWPTVGPPPVLDEISYELLAEQLVSSGVILDRRMIYWFARPSEHLPTLEVRIADVNADIDVTVLLALLVRALTRVFLAEARTGAGCPSVPEEALRDAHRRAALTGLRGTGLDPAGGEAAPMPQLLARLVERAAPGLEVAGDLPQTRALAARVLKDGTGAERQRAALTRRGTLRGVVQHLADLTAGSHPLRAGAPSAAAAVAEVRG